MAKKEKIPQRPTDANPSKERVRQTFHGPPPRRDQKANKAIAKRKTIAGRLVRELKRKLAPLQRIPYQKELDQYQRGIHQQRFDQDNIDALHQPFKA